MLYTLAVILLIAWLLGVVGTYTIGAFVHVLLVVAIVLFLVGIIRAIGPSFKASGASPPASASGTRAAAPRRAGT